MLIRRVNGWLTIVWVAMIPVSLATGWVKSVVYVSALSLWALVSGHWSAWQAARVEVTQLLSSGFVADAWLGDGHRPAGLGSSTIVICWAWGLSSAQATVGLG